jgi:hypothetical protein
LLLIDDVGEAEHEAVQTMMLITIPLSQRGLLQRCYAPVQIRDQAGEEMARGLALANFAEMPRWIQHKKPATLSNVNPEKQL